MEKGTKLKNDRIIGIDLSVRNTTGISILNLDEKATIIFKSVPADMNNSIVNMIEDGDIILIDAPLSLPNGRKSIEDRDGPHFRECDKMLRKLGIRFYPITIGGMRSLYKIGTKIAKSISKKKGVNVYEGFPGASLDMLGLKRKHIMPSLFKSFNVITKNKPKNIDEMDAGVLSITGYLYINKLAFNLGRDDGHIMIPYPGFRYKNGGINKAINKYKKLANIQNGKNPEEIKIKPITFEEWVFLK